MYSDTVRYSMTNILSVGPRNGTLTFSRTHFHLTIFDQDIWLFRSLKALIVYYSEGCFIRLDTFSVAQSVSIERPPLLVDYFA